MRDGSTHTPRKRFGQNFLVAPGIVRKIVAAIAPARGDCLVEIGPGLGALTEPLLDAVAHLDVVEIDRDLIARLRERFPPERLTVHEGDALDFDFGRLGAGLRIVGNLPYNISTPLLFHLARFAGGVRDMHFMLQREVVERMVAPAGGAARGRLSVMLQYRFDIERLFLVPPGAFNPAPKVDSAVVRLTPRPLGDLAARDAAVLAEIVAAAFSQRRKMLRNTLKGYFVPEALETLGVAPTARAEDIELADWVRVANAAATRQQKNGEPCGPPSSSGVEGANLIVVRWPSSGRC